MWPTNFLIRTRQSCAVRKVALSLVFTCLLATPSWVTAQTDDPATPADGAGNYDGLSLEEALSKALEIVTDLEDSDRDPDVLLEETPEYVETMVLVERVLEIDPLNKTAGYLNGRLLILTGRPRAALPMIEEYVADPAGQNNWRAYKILGDLYLASFPKHAVSKYRQAIALAENEPEPVIGLARAQLRLNNAKPAVERAQDAIRLDKKGEASYQATLAQALMLDKKFEDAARAAEAAVKMSEGDIARDPSNKLLLAEMQEHYDLRLQCVSQLAGLYPERADYIVQLAQIWQDKADLERVVSYHEAIVIIERSRTNPLLKVSPELLYEQARLNRLVSRDDKAMTALEELLQLNPDFAPAIELKKIIEAENGGLTEMSTTSAAGGIGQ
ncbi:MAG: hypothetical protein DHS20C16_33600 [Phycisphaerae bacterium]|nr:MAG: hypothetical protein DHS20C16_33600 [Phycisphaerae bacterium]